MGNKSTHNKIHAQEEWVRGQFESMGGHQGEWRRVRSWTGSSYSSKQVKAKLRQEYHHNVKPREYISQQNWSRMYPARKHAS